jgi:hypothetical protein
MLVRLFASDIGLVSFDDFVLAAEWAGFVDIVSRLA